MEELVIKFMNYNIISIMETEIVRYINSKRHGSRM